MADLESMDELAINPLTEYVADLDGNNACDTPSVSVSTQNALYRSVLSSYRDGLSDSGRLAAFALDSPDPATRALEAYQAQAGRVIDAVEQFLLSDRADTRRFEAEMDNLLRLRGAKSRRCGAVVDARGSRRRRR